MYRISPKGSSKGMYEKLQEKGRRAAKGIYISSSEIVGYEVLKQFTIISVGAKSKKSHFNCFRSFFFKVTKTLFKKFFYPISKAFFIYESAIILQMKVSICFNHIFNAYILYR